MGGSGRRSRLWARSGSALTRPRRVIHSRPVRLPPYPSQKEKNTRVGVFFFLVEAGGVEPPSENLLI